MAQQSPHTAPPTGSALSRYEGRATTAAEFYRVAATTAFVQEAPASVLADAWHGARLWALLDAVRFGPLVTRLDELLEAEHNVDAAGLARRNELTAAAELLTSGVEKHRQSLEYGEIWAHDDHFDIGPVPVAAPTDQEDLDIDEDIDSEWGVSGPLDDLADELGLKEHYPEQYGGGQMLYDENVYRVGWKGTIPATVVNFLAARGQTDWVRFHPVPHSANQLRRAASTLMDR